MSISGWPTRRFRRDASHSRLLDPRRFSGRPASFCGERIKGSKKTALPSKRSNEDRAPSRDFACPEPGQAEADLFGESSGKAGVAEFVKSDAVRSRRSGFHAGFPAQDANTWPVLVDRRRKFSVDADSIALLISADCVGNSSRISPRAVLDIKIIDGPDFTVENSAAIRV